MAAIPESMHAVEFNAYSNALPIIAAIFGGIAAAGIAKYWGADSMKVMGVNAFVTIIWALVGFSIVYAPDLEARVIGNGIMATIDEIVYKHEERVDDDFDKNDWYSIFAYTLSLVLLAVSVLSSATTKMAFLPSVIFTGLWVLTAYVPLAHWIFSPGGTAMYFPAPKDNQTIPGLYAFKGTASGALGSGADGYGLFDFAGVHTIHIMPGVSALVLNYWLGGLDFKAAHPAGVYDSLPLLLASLVAYIAGTTIDSNGITLFANAGTALTNAQLSIAGAVATWSMLEIVVNDGKAFFKGSVTPTGIVTASITGVVAISSGAAYISPMWAIFFGFFTTLAVYFAPYFFTAFLPASGINNGYSAFIVHAIGGIFSSALVGLFADPEFQAVEGAGENLSGSFIGEGNSIQIGKQCAGISIAIAVGAIVTSVVYWLVFWALRLSYYPGLKSLNEGDEGTEKL